MTLDRRGHNWSDAYDIRKVKFRPQISLLQRFFAFVRKLFGRGF